MCVGVEFKGFRRFHEVERRSVLEEQWFIQRLDHFNGADTRVWKQVCVDVLCVLNIYRYTYI